MTTEQTAALNRFLATLTFTQATNLMNVLSMHTENIRADVDMDDEDCGVDPADYDFIASVESVVVAHVAV